MNTDRRKARCKTTHCPKQVPFHGHAYCEDCLPIVWRTGRSPELKPAGR